MFVNMNKDMGPGKFPDDQPDHPSPQPQRRELIATLPGAFHARQQVQTGVSYGQAAETPLTMWEKHQDMFIKISQHLC